MRVIEKLYEEEKTYLIVSDNDIDTECAVHDTYSDYGQRISASDAGDYSFENPDCSFWEDMFEKAGLDYKDIKDKMDLYAEDAEHLDYNWYDDEELTKEEADEIIRKVNEAAVGEVEFVWCTAITYWDGSNHRSICLEHEQGIETVYKFADEETEQAIIAAYEKAEWESGCFREDAISDGWHLERNFAQGHFEIATVTPAREEEEEY